MKAIVIATNFFLFSLVASGQNMVVQTQSEWTVAGIQHGFSVGYETRSSWGLGVYYQAELEKENEENITRDDFRGVYLQAPVVKADKLAFFALWRQGCTSADDLVPPSAWAFAWGVHPSPVDCS
jgi:hypothetical protein